MLQTLFGLDGRLTRTGFWEVLVSVLLLDVAAGVAAITAFEQAFHGGPADVASATYEVVRWGLLAVAALSIWAILAAHVKRAHDLGHGAVILLWILVPVLGWLYLLYELGFKPGQNFRNRFGAQPLGHHDAHAAGEREIRFAGNHGHRHRGHDEIMPPPEARLDWTGAASEDSAEAAARRRGDYDPGEALMRASEHAEPEPAPPAPVVPPPATPPDHGGDWHVSSPAPAEAPVEAPAQAPDHSGLAAAMGTPAPDRRH